ncbi:MAG: energy transducer TonB [Cyclobacteriaceae bacterium]
MSTNSEPKKWEDIVFENRNKAYGAYVLRMIYSKNVAMAGGIAFLIMAFMLAYPTLAELLRSNDDLSKKPKVMRQVSLEQPPPIQPDQPPPPDIPPPPVKTIIKFLPPKVTEKEVVEEEKMPTIDEIKKNETGSENVEGTGEVVFDEPVKEVVKDDGDANKVYTAVEQPTEPNGGYEAFYKWVGKTIKYPPSARRMGQEGKTFVKFIVEPDGTITNVEIVRGFDGACDKEAERVIKISPRWKPGKQGGRAVRQSLVIPITFKLAE